MNESDETIIRYRLARASESLVEAKTLAGIEHWDGCVNRLYYACFYSALGLLMRHGLSSKKHSGVRSLFNLHFVKTKIVSEDVGEVYNTLFDDRSVSDYRDLIRMDPEDVRSWIPRTEEFVETISTLTLSA